MALTTPTIPTIQPFDARYVYVLSFNIVGGDQVLRNNLIIENATTNAVVYNQTIETMTLTYTIPANTLVNGTEYRFRVRTGNLANAWSEFSNSIIVKVLANANVAIINLGDGIIRNQSYTFQGTFSQANNEILESYRFTLYDQNGIVIRTGQTKFDGLLQETFNDFQNQTNYYVSLQTTTINGLTNSSAKYSFLVQFEQILVENVITLTNLPLQGSIQVTSQVVRFIFELGKGKYTFEQNEWVNLKNGMIYLEEGFNPSTTYTIQMWVKDIGEDTPFITLFSPQGKLEIKRHVRFGENKIYAFRSIYANKMIDMWYSEVFAYSKDYVYFIDIRQSEYMMNVHIERVS